MYNSLICTRSEMDITPVFGTVVGGSNPSGCTQGYQFIGIREGFERFFPIDAKKWKNTGVCNSRIPPGAQ